jgi:sortase (surface protein transpeptidase)
VGASHTRAALQKKQKAHQKLHQKKQKAHQKKQKAQKASKATSPQNDRFKAIRTATMGDVEIADEGVPRSAYELQALAIHARNQSFDSCRGGAKECV